MLTAPDPRSAPPLRWGVLAPGGIARAFADAVIRHTAGEVVAVGSRSPARARAFADRFGVPNVHGSYEALVTDPAVEAVYVASPHSEHHRHALMAIAAGRHVLVEKAFAVNEVQAREVFDAAGVAGVFAMEAMWTRFLPHMVAVREVIARGDIGELVGVVADHGQDMSALPMTHRLHSPELAGGALLDLGVYPVAFALDLLGAPDRVLAMGSLTATGVDGQVSIALGFGGRAQASLHTTLWARTATTAVVFGTLGRIEFSGDFYRPTSVTITRRDGARESLDSFVDSGLQYEAAEVARCVAEGRTQGPDMTWQDTLDVMRTMDQVRSQMGLRYPGE